MNLIRKLQPGNLPESAVRKGTLAAQREITLQYVLNILLGIITVALPVVLIWFPDYISPGLRFFYVIAYAALFALTFYRRIPYTLRALVILLFLHGTGTMALLSNGLVNFGWLFLFAGVILANLLLSSRFGFVYLFIALATIVSVAVVTTNGNSLWQSRAMLDPSQPSSWIISGVVFLFTINITIVSVFNVIRNLDSAVQMREKLTRDLEAEQALLEKRVEERSTDLSNRVGQFEVASQIARQISGEMNLDQLLNTAVNLIRDRFSYYHVGIFLNDEKNEFSVLRAATGEAGRQMLERSHRLKIGEIGLVGYTASRGEARVSQEVAGDSVHFKNPLLPQTRSEMALPLRIGEKTIGALDVQSVLDNAFLQDDIKILQMIADQLAIAVQKAQLVAELQETVAELESSYQVTTQKAWNAHLRNTRQKLAYRYSGTQLEHHLEEADIHAQEAFKQNKSVLMTSQINGQGRAVTVLAVPIKLRNQILGVVDIHFDSAHVSQDLITLIEGTVNRLAVSLENARLMEENQFRAERERLVSDISSKVRAASDVDTVLRVAIQELGKSLGVSEVMVQLRKEL